MLGYVRKTRAIYLARADLLFTWQIKLCKEIVWLGEKPRVLATRFMTVEHFKRRGKIRLPRKTDIFCLVRNSLTRCLTLCSNWRHSSDLARQVTLMNNFYHKFSTWRENRTTSDRNIFGFRNQIWKSKII